MLTLILFKITKIMIIFILCRLKLQQKKRMKICILLPCLTRDQTLNPQQTVNEYNNLTSENMPYQSDDDIILIPSYNVQLIHKAKKPDISQL